MGGMRYCLLSALCAVYLCAAPQTSLTVEQLVSFVKSSVELKYPDVQVAKFLDGVHMRERLDDRTVEELRSLGAGPKTLEALRTLRDKSQALPAPKAKPVVLPPAPMPPPSSQEQAAIIAEARENALHYTQSLPDFICTQVTRRYAGPNKDSYRLVDTLTARLSYFEQKEDYKLILINNRLTDQAYQKLGGALSTGEFGSILREIFAPHSEARFDWDHWVKDLRGRRAYVFSYRVLQPNSQWHVEYEHRLNIVPGYHGLVYLDQDTRRPLQITLEAEGIPPDFPVRAARTVLDYDYIDISGHEYLLPLRAEVRMDTERGGTRNEVEFRLYRKFSAETEIRYDTPPPLPDSQTKEQRPN